MTNEQAHLFCLEVAKEPNLAYLGRVGDDLIFRNNEMNTALGIKEIARHDPTDIVDVLMGRREAKVLIYLSRIVGYYSRISAWNKSKLAELKDRHKGNYGVPESVEIAPVVPPILECEVK
jgi:hypothetical protein